MSGFLQKVIDDLLPVLAVGAERDVNPVATLGVMLHNELVEDDVRLYPIKPPLAFYLVAVDAEVGSLSVHVLAVYRASDGHIQFLAPVSAAYLDFLAHRIA